MKRRLRIITYAWGRSYVANLLDITLPAVLAPGNLPALAEVFDCEFVLLTEQGLFAEIEAHPVYRRLAGIARAWLVPIDDLLVAPLYGLTLTWATYRGMADLGDAVTETDFLFFTADWIPADGSYRSLIQPLLNGERLIVAPSYCVVSEKVLPELKRRVDPETHVLAMPPREMAALGIPNRHNTIRGKTINSHVFHMDVIEQFYWLVDRDTLLCHQMPIAIVCMRPERWIPEPNTFWDYGTVSELCPNVTPCVLSDSDDFLMIELRSESTYDDGLRLGWPSLDAIGKKLASFVTRDHTVYGRHQLVWHSRDLPPETEGARAKLRAFVDQVFIYFDGREVSHVGHPFWAFQSSLFDVARRCVDDGLGSGRPLWSFFSKSLTGVIGRTIGNYERDAEAAWRDIAATEATPERCDALVKQSLARLARIDDAIKVQQAIHQRDVNLAFKDVAEIRENLGDQARAAAYAHDKAAGRAPAFTVVPAGARRERATDVWGQIADWLDRPGLQDPMWAATRHARRILDPMLVTGDPNILWVASDGADRLSRLTALGNHARTRLSAAHAASLQPGDLPWRGHFDLCVIEVDESDARRLRAIWDNVAPALRSGGKAVVFHFNAGLGRLPGDPTSIRRMFPRCDYGHVYFAGSWPTMVAIRGLRVLQRRLCGTPPAKPGLCATLLALFFAVPAMIANYFECREPVDSSLLPPGVCSGFTIDIDIP